MCAVPQSFEQQDTRMRPRIGLSIMPLETRREAIIGLATEGDRLGYDGFFLPETEIHPTVPAVVAETDAKAREGAAWFLSFYVTTMGTIYRDSLTRQGYGKAVEAVLKAIPVMLLGPNLTLEERALTLETFRPMLGPA
jgi:hypothetical protein